MVRAGERVVIDTHGPTAAPAAAPNVLPGWLVAVMAVATGFVVANLYFAQPLLHTIASEFGVGPGAAATVITTTQIGYAAGLVLLVPLGDLFRRRNLVPAIFAVTMVCLIVCAVAPTLLVFEIGTIAVGLTSIGGQIMIPFAASLAPEERRGRVVARMMTGLLMGILLARTFSGSLSELVGWRSIYWISAAVMLAFAVLLRRTLPTEPLRQHQGYPRLVASEFVLLATEPVLRFRAVLGALSFAAFSLIWTALTFVLSASPYNFGPGIIGLFGLVGAVGVLGANLAGKLADANRTSLTTIGSIVLAIGACGLIALGSFFLGALLIGIIVLDLATQGVMITNQAVIYGLRPDASSRMNSAYMFCYFVGGAIGSALAGITFAGAGWDGVCLVGAAFWALMMGAVAVEWVRRDRRPAIVPSPID